MPRGHDNSVLVFSTHGGRVCPECEEPVNRCRCGMTEKNAEPAGPLHVSRETGGRKGKTVTLVRGFPEHSQTLRDLTRELKQACATGGSAKGNTILIQGDHRKQAADFLRKKGYTVRESGG